LRELNHDVIVVGAGPAGTRIARDLAQRGLDVILLEEHVAVGAPCHCSGLISPRTLELAGVGDDLVHNTIRGALIHIHGATPALIGGDRVHAYAIERPELDRRLAAQAISAGATVLSETRFMRFSLHGDPRDGSASGGVIVTVRREGILTKLNAHLLVGADGARSRVAEQIRGAPAAGGVVGLGAVAHYDRNPREDHVEVFLDPTSAPGWFGWTIPLGNGMARLGTGTANGIKPRESMRRLATTFRDTFGAARIISHSGGLIALWEPTPLLADRVLLVGDAARQVKPTSGGGIYGALHAAGVAAEVAGEAFERGDLSSRSLQTYGRRWHRLAGRELRRQHDLRRIYNRLNAEDLPALLRVLEDVRMRRAVDSAGDIDFPSRLVRELARRQPCLTVKLLRWPRFPLAWLRSSE
jgi:geranylgeranyl reductase family protein